MAEGASTQHIQALSQILSTCAGEISGEDAHGFAEKLYNHPGFKAWIREICGQTTAYDSRAFRLLRDAEEEITQWKKVFKETITAVIPFTKTSEIFTFLNEIKEKLAEDEENIQAIHKAVSNLKKTLISHSLPASSEPAKTGGLFSKLFGKGQENVELIRADIVHMVNALDPIVPDSSKGELEDIKKRISQSSTFKDLTEANHHLVNILTDLSRQVKKEREQLNQFITELGKSLIEIEKNIVVSFDNAQKSRKLNTSFGLHLDTQIKDLNTLATSTVKTLDELRQVVLAKISAIKKALEAKRKQEEVINRELDRRFRRLQRDLTHINQEIHRVQTRERLLEQQILIDPLTGAFNRRAYEQRIQEEWQRFKRYGHVFSLVVLDLDHFKKINDKYGHSAGDLVLKEVVKRISKNLRESDLLFRYGGEEFVIILPGTELKGGVEVAVKIRSLIQGTKFVYKGDVLSVTVSGGVTQVLESDGDPLDVFDRADRALYQAKSSGRNRIVSIPPVKKASDK